MKKIAIEAPVTDEKKSNSLKPVQVLMDWSRLAQFKEFDDGARSMTCEVVALFSKELPFRTDDIRRVLSACDSAALSRAAHALKGAASNVGAQALSDACGILEQSCLEGQWPAGAAAQIEKITELAGKTSQVLKGWATHTG